LTYVNKYNIFLQKKQYLFIFFLQLCVHQLQASGFFNIVKSAMVVDEE
jgi:hypothetical protein